MVNGGTVASWICINFARNVQDNIARAFCSELAQMCNTSGMVLSTRLFHLSTICCLSTVNLLISFGSVCFCRHIILSLFSLHLVVVLIRLRES